MRVAGIQALPERRMTVRDLITPGRTGQNSVQFWQETGFTNNADAVSEGTQKPTSTITGQLVTANVATIAHIMIASKQVLDDAPQLQSHIDGRLRYGLAYEEELELLLGDGSGTQLLGLVPQATAYSAEFQPELMQRIDYIRLAMLQSELALFPATGTVLNPIDWARIELTKDLEGRYIFAMPQNETTPRLWGRPVVSTPAMTATKFLTGAFKLGAQIFDREDANVEISTEDSDNFQKNLVTIRGEERLALTVYRPEAFTYGTFQATT
jgi:HK97 family phage major capsid protein